jgi:hypothetical protein
MVSAMSVRPLFHDKGSLTAQLAAQEQRAIDAVKKVAPDRLLATPEADLIDELVEPFGVEPLQLHPDRAESLTGVAPTRVDISRNPHRVLYGQSPPTYIDGTRYELAVPFDGEEVFLDLQPNTFLGNAPRGDVRGRDVVIMYEGLETPTAEAIKAYLDEQLILLDQWSSFSRKECVEYNQRLRTSVGQAIDAQRQRILAYRRIDASLPFPVRRRTNPNAVLSIAVPPRRPQKLTVLTRSPAKDFAPEPQISQEDFAAIIADIRSMGLAAERFPDTFGEMPEPVLREILLVVLNNQFVPSGGELFSRRGKTDVAIWHETGAVFIAECKFWTGEKDFSAAIDQLLGYLVWRDTKSALVLFVRQKNVSEIQRKAGQALGAHPRYKRQATDVSGCPVFILHHEGDVNKEIDVALAVVAVPPAL